MPDTGNFALFPGAAFVLAATPGPGILCVAARTLASEAKGSRRAWAPGSAAASTPWRARSAFPRWPWPARKRRALLKLVGAAHLLRLGFRTIMDARAATTPAADAAMWTGRAFREGVAVEALDPKTAGFFLAFPRSSWTRLPAASPSSSPCSG